MKKFIFGVVGAAIGAGITYVIQHKKVVEANEEVEKLLDEINEAYHTLNKLNNQINEMVKEAKEEKVDEVAVDILEGSEKGKLIPIDFEAFGSIDGYETQNITLYKSGELVGEDDDVVHIGEFDKSKLVDGVGFFRDPVNEIDYQIVSVKIDR